MATQQGSTALLQDPVAQELLKSTIPARLAYNWRDGSPRVVPIWFHWTGSEVVVCSPPGAPKLKVLKDGAKVALTIDSITPPWKVLMIRGSVRLDTVQGVAPDYASAARRYMGEEGGNAWIAQITPITTEQTRVCITPEWVGLLDFQTRFPSAIAAAMGGGS